LTNTNNKNKFVSGDDMYFMYVDESGDGGHNIATTKFFTLSGIIIRDSDWRVFFDRVKGLRKKLKDKYQIPIRAELHSCEIWQSKNPCFKHLSYAQKKQLFTDIAFFLRRSPEIKIINISINKANASSVTNIYEFTWKLLIQRFENYLISKKDFGIVFADEGQNNLVVRLTRKMKVYNPIPSRFTQDTYNKRIEKILEDPNFRQSKNSFFIQLSDICCYLARLRDNATVKQKHWGCHKMYKIMKPAYLLEASINDNYGFVYK